MTAANADWFASGFTRFQTEAALILRRPLDVIDHENIERRFTRFEFQSQLFFNRGEYGRARVRGRRVRFPFQIHLELAGKTGTIEHFAFQHRGESSGKILGPSAG